MMVMTKEEKAEEEKGKRKAAAPKAKAPKGAEEARPAVKAEGRAEAKAEHAPKAEHHVQRAEAKPEHKTEVHRAEAPKPVPGAKAEAAPRPEPKRKKAAQKKKPARKVFVVRGKRKESVARATIQEGKGAVRINRVSLDALSNRYMKEIIREPLRYVGPEAGSVDISVSVCGGGAMGQAQAARTAIANALVAYFDAMKLKEKFLSIDRTLLIEDTRRVETKKFRGPKARARFQKSYR